MTEETDYFLSQDGLRLYYRHWPAQNPIAVLCIVHGLGEHSGRYMHVAKFLSQRNISVLAMDLRGHGLSKGKKGHSKSYSLLLSDVEELLKVSRSNYTELPMFLMGHSMGGNLAANFIIKMRINELAGYILSSPWFRLAFTPPKWKLNLVKFMVDVFPAFTSKNELNAAHLSKDPEVVRAYENDPHVHDKISAGLFHQIYQASEYALTHNKEINKPGLVYHGDADQIIDWRASKDFAERGKNCEWKRLQGTYHEPHNDLEKTTVLEMINEWIQKNIRG